MEEFRIKKIKNLGDAKRIFNFISASFVHERMMCGEDFVPLHELYETIVDNVTNRKEFQFFGTLNKNIVGAVVSSPLLYNPKCLYIHIIGTAENSRKKGFANVMLAELEMFAKRKGFEKIRVLYNDLSYRFFVKNNYKLFLELAIPESLLIEDVLKINNLALHYSQNTKYNQINFVEYSVEKADRRLTTYISKNTPLVKASFILEKTFSV